MLLIKSHLNRKKNKETDDLMCYILNCLGFTAQHSAHFHSGAFVSLFYFRSVHYISLVKIQYLQHWVITSSQSANREIICKSLLSYKLGFIVSIRLMLPMRDLNEIQTISFNLCHPRCFPYHSFHITHIFYFVFIIISCYIFCFSSLALPCMYIGVTTTVFYDAKVNKINWSDMKMSLLKKLSVQTYSVYRNVKCYTPVMRTLLIWSWSATFYKLKFPI